MNNIKDYFDDPKRARYRHRKGRSFITDFVIYSNTEDYYLLRAIVNLPLGLGISVLLYNWLFYRINFLDEPALIPPVFAELFKWLMILSSTVVYALNPFIRCVLILAMVGCLGSQGRTLLTVFAIEKTSQGPVMNILQNFNVSSNIIICNLDLQANITRRRIELKTGPAEEFLEKRLGNGTSIGKKVIYTLKSLLKPFDEDLYEESSEDDYLAAITESAKALADREKIVEGDQKEGPEFDESKFRDEHMPIWTRFHSQLGRAIARRYMRRCDEMFSKTIDTCHKKFEDTQSNCYKYTPFYLAFFTCRRMNALDLCQPERVNSMMEKLCDLGNRFESTDSSTLTPDLDEQMFKIQNVHKQIERQLKLNLHFLAVEHPELERAHALSEMRIEIEHEISLFRITHDFISFGISMVMVFFLFIFFKGYIRRVSKYLNDIKYRNNFITQYFRDIDEERRQQGRSTLLPLTSAEKEEFKLITPCAYPTNEELRKLCLPLSIWFMLVVIIGVQLLVDHYYYKLLLLVTKHANIEGAQKGKHIFELAVNGTGPLSDIIRDILNQNYKQNLYNKLTTAICLIQPHAPDWGLYTRTIFLPLFGMLVLIAFNFAVNRVVLLVVLPLMFRRRYKARIIGLYNKILRYRANNKLSEIQ